MALAHSLRDGTFPVEAQVVEDTSYYETRSWSSKAYAIRNWEHVLATREGIDIPPPESRMYFWFIAPLMYDHLAVGTSQHRLPVPG